MSARSLRTFSRISALAGKEVRHVLRDPRTLALALAMPVLLLLLFGFGVSFDVDRVPVGFVDHDRSEASRTLARRLLAGSLFDSPFAAGELLRSGDAERALVSGEVALVVVIERGFAEELARAGTARVQLLIDGADSASAVQVQARAESAIRAIGLTLGPTRAAGARAPLLEARTFTRFNPEARSAVFLVPGLTAYVLAMVAVLLTSLTIAREWERGSMLQLFATPVGRFEIVIGKLLPYLVLGTLSVLLVVAVGGFVFDVPFRGSPSALGLLSLLFLACMLGQGLFISVITQNQMVATQAATMSSTLPSLLLSGFVFPIDNMPRVLQWVSHVVPARYYVAALRAILLRGNDLSQLWREALLLLLFATLMLTLATVRFRRTIA